MPVAVGCKCWFLHFGFMINSACSSLAWLLQVLGDWRGQACHRDGTLKPSSVAKWGQRLGSFMLPQVNGGITGHPKTLKQVRLANEAHVGALGHPLLTGASIGLDAFRPQVRPHALRSIEKRLFVDMADLPLKIQLLSPGRSRRACA